MARQKALDNVKKREICALLTAGMSMARAARHVGCGRKTVYRELHEDPDFSERVRRARLAVDLSPREAMRRFAATHWRAAAWLLDREERHEAARRAAKYYTQRDLDNVAESVQQVLHRSLVIDPWDAPTVAEQVDDVFHQAEPGGKTKPPARAPRRSGPTLAESMRFLEKRWAERAAAADDQPTDPQPAAAPPLEPSTSADAPASIDTLGVSQITAPAAARGDADPANTDENARRSPGKQMTQ